MRLVSFDAFRTLGLPGCRLLKSEQMFRDRDIISESDWVLFPEYWQINTLLYGLKARIFPSPASYHLGYDKIEMTYAFQSFSAKNFPTTLILNNSAQSIERVLDEMCFPFVAKEPRNSMGRGVFLINNRSEFNRYAQANPLMYVQEYLPIDRDLRVVLIGDKVFCSYWRVAQQGCFLNNVAQGAQIVYEEAPAEALRLVEQFAAFTGVNHAGFDIATVDGHCYFLEFNRLFGNSGLGAKQKQLIPVIQDYLQRMSQPPLQPHNGGVVVNQ